MKNKILCIYYFNKMGLFQSKPYCYYCPDPITDHSTNEHICDICNEIGKHGYYHHSMGVGLVFGIKKQACFQ